MAIESQPGERCASQEIAGVKEKERLTFPPFVLSNCVHSRSQSSEPPYGVVISFRSAVYCRWMRYELGMYIVSMEYAEV
jgi:hypothetical protein